MAKGYWIAHIDVTDPDGYQNYVPLSTQAIADYGGQFLVRGGAAESPEGEIRARHIVVEFPTYEIALECYRSQSYEAARAVRRAHSDADITIVKGIDS